MNENYTIGELLHINWNRMSFLSRNKNEINEAEMDYRIAVQNHFSGTGNFDKKKFIMPDNHEKYIYWDKKKKQK